MGQEAEGLPFHVIHSSYAIEETTFLKSCTNIYCSKVLNDANVIGRHVLYNVKMLDDHWKLCKAVIARAMILHMGILTKKKKI